ncbi:uncharacterized protein LOC114529421 [Dendronephthya gigantea]|uniref:uncharacterized protein LOC114529421 n=1 Tax=Dendronephthya gigantea TaxID=151771 RepID=UPI00106D2508|nr:uncharacterized protein LOC114529421 [Dendronephthya gigantea]
MSSEEKHSIFSNSHRKTSPTVRSKRRHKKIERCKSSEHYNEERGSEKFGDFPLEKQVCRIIPRINSLPNIQAVYEHETLIDANPWSRKSWCKRYSLKRSQSMEWEPISALFTAATEDDLVELERILQEFEIELNFLGPSGISPLHTAALTGSTRAVQLLINSGAKVDFLDDNKRTSLEIALLAGNFDCAAMLIENGACMRKIIDGIQVH